MIRDVFCVIGLLKLFMIVICLMLINLCILIYIRVCIDVRRDSVIRNEFSLYRIMDIF